MSEKQYITKMITIENTSDAAINNFIADKDVINISLAINNGVLFHVVTYREEV